MMDDGTLSTTMLINLAPITPQERKSFFRTLDAIRALPEVRDERPV